MGKILAILAASAAVAGGGAYAFFHYTNPYRCGLADCEVARMKCCAEPTAADACPTSEATPATAVAAAGPVALFTTTHVSAELPCCAAARAQASARASCCAAGAACCANLEPCCPALTAAVGPAATVR
jgi:hypothetical protein